MSTVIESTPETVGDVWVLTEIERQHIADLVGVEATTFNHVKGNHMNKPKECCSGCGKKSGLDDIVHNALDLGIHSNEFIIRTLVEGPKNDSPAHQIYCSNCGETFAGQFYWIPSSPWCMSIKHYF